MSMLSAKDLHGLEGLEPSVAIARLTTIRDGLATSNDPELLARLAKAIPTRVSGLAPEVALLLADVAGLLVGYALTIPRDIDQLAAERLRVAWLRVALSRSDGEEEQQLAEQLAASLAEDTLLLTLTGWTWYASAAHPLPIFRRLALASDPRLRRLLIERVEGAVVQHLALTGEQAFDCLAPLAATSELQVTIREGALRTLAKFWLVGLSPARARLRDDHIQAALRDPEPRIASAAMDAAYALGARRWLSDLLNEETGSSSSAVKARALDALGPIADRSDLEIALALADEDPLQFGPPVRRFLLEAHRHGVFLREPHHVDAVLRLFDTHLAWTGEELVRVTYIARAILVKKLAELPVDDARWIRRASILAASLKTGAHRVLEDLLDRIDPGDKSGWPIAAAVVDAAAAAPELAENGATEHRLLRFLNVLPEHVLPALRVKGAIAAAKKLRTIVLDPFTTRAMRTLAMDVLWSLTDDRRSLLTELATTLPPHESGLLESKYLSARDSTAAELLEKSNERRTIPALDQLKIFCESGDVRFLAEVTRLFREVFRTYVRKALEGDFTIKRLLMPELEQLVFRYGRHLIKDGRSIRRFVDAGGGPETGRELVLLLVIDWLNDVAEPPSDPIVVALLETASRHAPDGAYLRFIEPFWRRGDANVRRAALEALVAAGPSGSRGLELSLGRLVAEANDPRILTQALAAVRALRAAWAEPLVRNVLERREMAVKKEAAEALAEIGTGQSVASLVGWIGRHDNASFRTQLLRALDKSAGPAFVLVLVDALEKPDLEGRTRDLLLDALNDRLSIATVVRLARVGRAPEIVDACLDGRIAVQGATADEVAAQLYRAKLRPLDGEKKKDPTQRLRIEGFSAAAAREVVNARMAQYRRARWTVRFFRLCARCWRIGFRGRSQRRAAVMWMRMP